MNGSDWVQVQPEWVGLKSGYESKMYLVKTGCYSYYAYPFFGSGSSGLMGLSLILPSLDICIINLRVCC